MLHHYLLCKEMWRVALCTRCLLVLLTFYWGGSVYNSLCIWKHLYIYSSGSSHCFGCWRLRCRVVYNSMSWRGSPVFCKIWVVFLVSGTISPGTLALLRAIAKPAGKPWKAALCNSQPALLPFLSSVLICSVLCFPHFVLEVLGFVLSVSHVSVWEGGL